MELTRTFETVFEEDLLKKYKFCEVRSASSVLSIACKEEWKEFIECLKAFQLRTQDLMIPGGSKSKIVVTLESLFHSRGWTETRIDTEQIIYKVPKVANEKIPHKLTKMSFDDRLKFVDQSEHITRENLFQEGYLIDALKGRLAIDIEWNAKDGNLDRDIAAYRAWYDLGVIDGAILITKEIKSCKQLVNDLWSRYVEQRPELAGLSGSVDLGTSTTTTIEKAQERIVRGDGGGCPILVVGVTANCWDGVEIVNVPNVSAIVAGAKKKTKAKKKKSSDSKK